MWSNSCRANFDATPLRRLDGTATSSAQATAGPAGPLSPPSPRLRAASPTAWTNSVTFFRAAQSSAL